MDIKQGNPKAFETLNLRLKELASKQGKVGWFPGSRYPDSDVPVAYAAALNELGHGKTPARQTMRPAVIKNENIWKKIAAQGAAEILAGKADAETVMEKLTISAQSAIAKNIATLTEPPLSPITIGLRKLKSTEAYKTGEKKVTGKTVGEVARLLHEGNLDLSGVSTKPLVDTGLMFNTLESIVEDANAPESA